MSGEPAVNGARLPRVLLVDAGKTHDVFDVTSATATLVRARTPFLFEIGEELTVRVEHDGNVVDAIARVRAHVGNGDELVTELELMDQGSPRRLVSG